MNKHVDLPLWYTEEAGFFGAGYLTEYAGLLTKERTAAEVAFVKHVLDLPAGASILDVPSGHGRHAIPLAVQGFDVTCVDLNNFFLDEAKKRVVDGKVTIPSFAPYSTNTEEEIPVNIRFRQSDMRELSFDGEFDAAINMFTAMGYFENDEEDMKFLRGVHRALRPGGKFLLDYLNVPWVLRNYRPASIQRLPDGGMVLTERTLDLGRGYIHDARTWIRSGRVEETRQTVFRMYMPHELVAMATRAGFTLTATYGDFDESSLTLTSPRAIFFLEK